MNKTAKWLVIVSLLVALCMNIVPAFAESGTDSTEGTVQETVEQVQDAVEDAAEAVGEAATEAADAVEQAAEEAGAVIEEAVEETAAEAEAVESSVSSWASNAFSRFGKTSWYIWVIVAVLAVAGIVGIAKFSGSKGNMSTRVMAEGAMMIALATVLSLIKMWEMPFGGSITLFSMLPIVLMSYRHGTKWGVLTAFAYSVLQLVLGIKNVGYCATLGAQIACILLDYVLAFTVLGLASAFSKPFKNRTVGVIAGTAIVGVLRFVCHFISGIFLWGSYQPTEGWISTLPTWLYSIVYNGGYMLPEIIITVIGAALLVRGASRLFDKQAA